MKNKTIFITMIAFVLSLVAVSATVDVTFSYVDSDNSNSAVTGVDVFGVTCLDNSCTQVTTSPFSVSTNSGSSSTSLITFPTNLAGTGYAVFWFKSGYLPVASKVTVSGSGSTSATVPFKKKQNCNSLIDSFSVTNNNFVNEPLQISVSSSLDANTHSAFELASNVPVNYIPSQYADEFYAAETTVTLVVTNSAGNVVSTQSKTVNLRASQGEEVTFDWVPTTAGDYTATVSTQVTDNQCSNSFSQSTSKSFSVLPARATNECYTLLNDLAVSPSYPKLEDTLTFSINKISNEAGATAGSFTARPTTFTTTIRRGSSTVFSNTETVAASSTTTPAPYQLQFTPDSTGNYTISVTGRASTCSFATNRAETETLNFEVRNPSLTVSFQLRDKNTGAAVSGAEILFAGQAATSDSNGFALFQVTRGTYTYLITHSNYKSLTGSLNVDTDNSLVLFLEPRTAGDVDESFQTISAVATSGSDRIQNDALITSDVSTSDASDVEVRVVADFYLNDVAVRSQSETYTVDGNAVDNHQFTVANLERGTYTIVYTLYDAQGNIEDIEVQQNFVISDITGEAEEREQGRIRIDGISFSQEQVMPGDDVLVYVTLENTGDIDFDDVKVKAVSLEMGTMSSSRRFDLNENRERTSTLMLNVPEEIDYGVYSVRVIIEDDNGRIKRVMHRDLRVGPIPRRPFITIISEIFGLEM